MNTCKTCKWWGEKIPHALESDRRNLHYRPCEWCGEGGRIHSEEQVCVDPDFGCIHYEETQEQLPEDHPGYKEQLIKKELGPGELRSAQGVPFGQVTHLFNPLTGDNEHRPQTQQP